MTQILQDPVAVVGLVLVAFIAGLVVGAKLMEGISRPTPAPRFEDLPAADAFPHSEACRTSPLPGCSCGAQELRLARYRRDLEARS